MDGEVDGGTIGGVQTFVDAIGADPVRLDLSALAISAHCVGHGAREAADALETLDELAERIGDASFDRLVELLFSELGFSGDTANYGRLDNCLLDRVLKRRRGIPVTLAVVAMEVGRRVGLETAGIAMPGHFMLSADDGRMYDCFHRRFVTADEAEAIFRRIRPQGRFREEFLQPVETHQVVRRLLLNLHGQFTRALALVAPPPSSLLVRRLRQPRGVRLDSKAKARRVVAHRAALAPLLAVMELSVCLPDAKASDYEHLAQLLMGTGRLDEAARQLTLGAERFQGKRSKRLETAAERLWARLN